MNIKQIITDLLFVIIALVVLYAFGSILDYLYWNSELYEGNVPLVALIIIGGCFITSCTIGLLVSTYRNMNCTIFKAG